MRSDVPNCTGDEIEVLADHHGQPWGHVQLRQRIIDRARADTMEASIALTPDQLDSLAADCIALARGLRGSGDAPLPISDGIKGIITDACIAGRFDEAIAILNEHLVGVNRVTLSGNHFVEPAEIFDQLDAGATFRRIEMTITGCLILGNALRLHISKGVLYMIIANATIENGSVGNLPACFEALQANQRLAMFEQLRARFCMHCGSTDPHCQCNNDD